VARAVHARLDDLVGVLLLPVFFVLTGLHTEFGLIRGGQWALCAGVVVVACVGKVGGTYWAARLMGLAPREAGVLGVLMNTRGLMGLVVLEVGRDLGVISPTVHAMLVVTAVVTTLATAPVLGLLDRGASRAPAATAGP
jgi:Kef-type K+ transport system membrane component KefB